MEKLEGQRAAAAAVAEEVAVEAATPVIEPEVEPVTVMDVNVEDTVAAIGEKPSEPATSAHDEVRAAIDAMIAEVKAAEPQLAERLGAASAEWMMVNAVKAAEPYLSSEGAGSAATKLLRAVKAAEPFASRRMDAAAAIWNIVLTVKEAEPRIQRGARIDPAEYDILRAIKAAEPHLVQDLDMGGTASKLLRAVKLAEPRRPRFGAELAEAQILKNAKWSEPVLRRTEEAAKQGKPLRRVMANCSPIEEPAPSTTGTPPAAGKSQPQVKSAPRRRPSNQPVRNLGVNDSGEWHFTLLAPLDGPSQEGLQIQSREIMLSRESVRSWAGELLSLWHA